MSRRGGKKSQSAAPVIIPPKREKQRPKAIKQYAENAGIAQGGLGVIAEAATMPIPTLKASPPAQQLQQLLAHVGNVTEPEYLVQEAFRVWAETPAQQGLLEVDAALHALPKLRRALAIALLMTKCAQQYDDRMLGMVAEATDGVYTNSRATREKRNAALLGMNDEENQDDNRADCAEPAPV